MTAEIRENGVRRAPLIFMGCISELFQLLGNAVLEQTVRALLTK